MGKFVYENENEVSIVSSQCELCKYFNDGNYSDSCPMELIDSIKNGDIKCPKLNQNSFFDNLQ